MNKKNDPYLQAARHGPRHNCHMRARLAVRRRRARAAARRAMRLDLSPATS